MSTESFRAEIRTWLDENCPESMRQPAVGDEIPWGGRTEKIANPEARLWLERMGERGFTAPTWSREYGGGGLSAEENKVLQEELRRIKARPALVSFGLSMLGPALLEFANEEQKREHLPKIVKGEVRWCQGYSEPGSGSDLASLQTRAAADGEDFVVNGQKIWTSYADHADWIFCLVRTDPAASKHDGISFLLFDMASPGVTVAPIKLISGSSPFCQTFLEEVRVPAENLVGQLNSGWTIAKRLLQHERSMISGMGQSGMIGGGGARGFAELGRTYIGDEGGRIADPVMRDQMTQVQLDSLCFDVTMRRSAEEARAGQGPGAKSSMFKYYGTELNTQY